ncbi:hypothetical protein GDO81_000483 [Engystomops pustulosus]|uniref:exodeoxyribonuclease III n=1 Tax=Engystomops pustulosus TaxID=76066 RepID=A0AAV7D5B1_ENGPU|nr:hypothetical protein GDO81_000483 [Engystomops pustulosus]
MSIKLMSLNVKGLNSPFKRSLFWKEALNSKGDIVCIQETHVCQRNPPKISHPRFQQVLLSTYNKKKRGVLIAFKDTLAVSIHQTYIDPQSRFIIVLCSINNIDYTLVNLYAPNRRQKAFFTKLFKKIKEVKRGSLLICGDFTILS